MKQHEREYFISVLRSGIVTIRHRGFDLKVNTLTIEQSCEACQVYAEAYDMAYMDEVMDEGEMLDWMESKGLWTEEDEEREEGLEKDMEKLKTEIYTARNNVEKREHIRKYIRAGEEQQADMILKKKIYHANTCEGMAEQAKWEWVIKHCTTLNGSPYDFKAVSLEYVLTFYRSSLLNERQIRELARNEPWRSLWVIHERASSPLFLNKDRELNIDQRNLVIWAKMYDNIQESMDCPNEDVIDDDDMLDGWFIIQRNKRENDKMEAEFEGSVQNDKIKNAGEVFMMVGSKEDADRVESMNDMNATVVKRQREAIMKRESGSTQQGQFVDEKIKLQNQAHEQYKGKFGR
jgi:hypothetical protein